LYPGVLALRRVAGIKASQKCQKPLQWGRGQLTKIGIVKNPID